MKRFRNIFTLVSACIISLVCNEIKAADNTVKTTNNDNDSIEISLLTCSPGDEVYSLYGHTAIRYTNYSKGIDIAVNYGIFSFSKPFFIPRFIFGITDYEMGVVPFDYFCMEYESEGRSIIQQRLNLTQKEKTAIRDALITNYLPQNRVYRYNYLYDNCTTRARDIMFGCMEGTVKFNNDKGVYPSFREAIHTFNTEYPWARFGNDLLLGVKSDKKTDIREHQFLPFNLKEDFDNAVIISNDGSTRPLVKESKYIVNAGVQTIGGEFPLRPRTCALIVLAITIAVTCAEYFLKKRFWGFDALMLLIYGCVGVVIFMMFFSEHPTTSTNLQIFLFNPLPLFFIYRMSKRARKKEYEPFWKYATIAIILFFIAGFFQHYAEGTYILALSLLLRCVWNIYCQNKYPLRKK